MMYHSICESPSTTQPKYLSHLDSLRGIACVTVLVSHLNLIPIATGAVAVDVLFCLSGFLITRILLAKKGGSDAYFIFYRNRCARIIPPYYITVVAVSLFWSGDETGWAADFTLNLRMLTDSHAYFQDRDNSPPVSHCWSICVEEHFYWIWPLIVLALPPTVTRRICWSYLSVAPLMIYLAANTMESFGMSREQTCGLLSRATPFQLTAILIGSLIALFEESIFTPVRVFQRDLPRTAVLGVFLLALGGVACTATTSRVQSTMEFAVWSYSQHVLSGAIFLIAVATPSLGRLSLLRGAGAISYGLYVYHLPIFSALGVIAGATAPTAWQSALSVVLTVLAACISYTLIERPIMTRVRRNRANGIGSLIGPAMMLILFGVFVRSATGIVYEARLMGRVHGQNSISATEVVPPPSFDSSDMFVDFIHARLEPRALPYDVVTTIIVGTSHSLHGIASPMFDDIAYNCGYSSQHLYYDSGIVEQLTSRLPRLRRVIIPISAFSFRASVEDRSISYLEPAYLHAWSIRPRADQRDILSMKPDENSFDLRVLRRKATLVDEPLRGWMPLAPKLLKYESGLQAATRHNSQSVVHVKENRLLLSEMVRRCRERGLEVVLVGIPTHECYRKHLLTDQVREVHEIVDDVAIRSGAIVLDYAADSRFTDVDFADGDHLSIDGAKKFTRILVDDL